MKIKAMSLVELSVAMAIIALIITTTLTAFSLIYKTTVLEAIRSITTLETKTAEFQATFGRLPGDMEYATDYWNLDEFKSFCQYKNSSNISLNIAKGFDGDGDGYVDIEKNNISSTDNFTESSAFMCHLRLADMITHNPVVVKLVSTQKQINNLAL
ncbi:hypothetical protein, partial [Candidatus Xenohaliotis californiensis]|uniref:type II secretion system protein n=1 Tax=Candidatus Xenohaliotis californiensis TaxID=84677 RepID=UPI0030C8451F